MSLDFKISNTMGTISGVVYRHRSGEPKITLDVIGDNITQSLIFCVAYCGPLSVFVIFFSLGQCISGSFPIDDFCLPVRYLQICPFLQCKN